MFYLYCITNKISGRQYIGMTGSSLNKRMSGHKCAANLGKKSKLYDAIRSYGFDNFSIEAIQTFETKQECCEAEIKAIASRDDLYNLASGGEGGFTVSNIEEWKKKLRAKRAGRKPALGMKHSEENRKFFSACTKRKKLLYDVELPATFKEANTLLGISRTHYYRLVKRARSNEPS